MIEFGLPLALGLLALPPLLHLWQRRRPPAAGLPFSATGPLAALPRSLRQRAATWLPWLQILALMLGIVALARPQWGMAVGQSQHQGVAITVLVDISSSMGALDLELEGQRSDRLAVVKTELADFIKGDGSGLAGRTDDAIGIATFARYADPISSITMDHAALLALLDEIAIVRLPEEDGTAIGDALMLAIEQLRQQPNASRVIVLMTDGSHNAGVADPQEAAAIAAALGLRIYTIGTGSRGEALMPKRRPDGGIDYVAGQVHIDEFLLRKIADLTHGRYFRATDQATLGAIYGAIDRLEKGTNLVTFAQQRIDLFPGLLAGALGLVLLQATLAATWLRRLP